MKIYSMTATFGKLNHETLTLEPGLNVISAPNEWGKSTWCAFLINMLYGIDTKQRSGGSVIPDKERYAPWSGAPMAGRIDLNWNGRDITIERSTKGRVIFGNFRAYETETGLDIPELDSSNCGRVLLGVERSVFTRSGFIRLTDMPVTADDALRRRLNDLVTTGDESGAGDKLSDQLKDLKNKCRYNNSGLLPQAEAERDQLQKQLAQILEQKSRYATLLQQEQELKQQIDDLTNHEATLRYNAAREDALRIQRTQEALDESRQKAAQLEAQLATLPEPSQAKPALDAGNQLNMDVEALAVEKKMLPPAPEKPSVPTCYEGFTPEQAVALSQIHFKEYREYTKKKTRNTQGMIGFLIAGFILIAAAIAVFAVISHTVGLCIGAAALVLLILGGVCGVKSIRCRKELQILHDAHPGISPDCWEEDAQQYLNRQKSYWQALADYDRRKEDLHRRELLLAKQIATFAGEGTLQQRLQQWNQALTCKAAWDAACVQIKTLQEHLDSLKAMARNVTAPACPDRLTLPMDQTVQQLANTRARLQQIQSQLHQCKGRSEALGQEAVVRSRLDTLLRRINRLEDTYHALEIAQDSLYKATLALQRRFAPRISKQAQELFGQLTDGRYDRLTMAADFSLNIGAQQEDTLMAAQWRSDGTVDQLYLALRLAVSGELTPEAPLVLDDALVRFDDTRLKNAMVLLKQLGDQKQILLFTCQSRENEYL